MIKANRTVENAKAGICLGLGMAVLGASVPPASAQEAPAAAAAIELPPEQSDAPLPRRGRPARGPWLYEFEGGALYQPKTDIDDGGNFSVGRWTTRFGVNYGWDRQTSVGITIGAGASNYDFGDKAMLGGSEPWDRIEDYRVSLPIRFGFGETGNAIIIPSLRYNGEAGASWQDSQTYGAIAAAFWQVSSILSIGPGVGVFTTLEDGTRAFPILAIDWDITDRLSLSTGGGLGASQGPGIALNYQANDALKVGIAGRVERLEFRLDANNSAAPGGIGKDQSLPIVTTLAWEPNPGFSLSAFAGVELDGQLKLKDRNDRLIERRNYDTAPIFGATIRFRF